MFATDSQAEEDTGIRRSVDKIEVDEEHCLIWAGTGDVAMIQPVNEAIREAIQKSSRSLWDDRGSVRGLLRRTVSRTMKELLNDLVVAPNTVPDYSQGRFLFVRCQPCPHIVEVECIGKATDYSELGFQAVGAGGPVAQVAHAMLRHHDVSGRTLEQAKVIAYRVISFAIETLARGIGFPVQMVIASDDEIVRVTEDEIEALRTTVDLWKETERNELRQLYGLVEGTPTNS